MCYMRRHMKRCKNGQPMKTSRHTIVHFRRWRRFGQYRLRVDMVVDTTYRRGGAWWLRGKDFVRGKKWWRATWVTR